MLFDTRLEGRNVERRVVLKRCYRGLSLRRNSPGMLTVFMVKGSV